MWRYRKKRKRLKRNTGRNVFLGLSIALQQKNLLSGSVFRILLPAIYVLWIKKIFIHFLALKIDFFDFSWSELIADRSSGGNSRPRSAWRIISASLQSNSQLTRLKSTN